VSVTSTSLKVMLISCIQTLFTRNSTKAVACTSTNGYEHLP